MPLSNAIFGFIFALLNGDKSIADQLISIHVYALNHDLDKDTHALMIAKFVVSILGKGDSIHISGNHELERALWEYFNGGIGDGEDWDYMGRDEEGEKTFFLNNPGSVQELYTMHLHREWKETFQIAA